MFQLLEKMYLLGPVCLGFLLVVFIEGSQRKERIVQLRREKRDVDLLVSCDEHCLPEDQIKDYDILLEYDDDAEAAARPSLVDNEKKSCAFACKIVDTNKTNESSDFLEGKYKIITVEELISGNGLEPSNASDYDPLGSMVGLHKNVSLSPTVSENVTKIYEPPNETSTCSCTNNSENFTPAPKPTDENVTDSTLSSQYSSTSFVEVTQENTVYSNFMEVSREVVNETTTEKQLFTVVPIIPKVIKFTVVEVEMAEAGTTTAPSVEKAQPNSYSDVNNNASMLLLERILEQVAQLGVQTSEAPRERLGLDHKSHENEKQNLTSSTLSYEEGKTPEGTILQTLTSQEPSVDTFTSEYTSKKSVVEDEHPVVTPGSVSPLDSFQDIPFPAPSLVTINSLDLANLHGTVTPPSFLTTSSTSGITSTSVKYNLNPKELIESNRNNTTQNETSSSLVVAHTTEALKETQDSKATPSPQLIGATTSAQTDMVPATTNSVISKPVQKESEITVTMPSNLNRSFLSNESTFINTPSGYNQTVIKPNLTPEKINCSSTNITDESCNNFEKSGIETKVPNSLNSSLENSTSVSSKESIATKKEDLPPNNNVTSLNNETIVPDDISKVTGNNTTERTPLSSEKSSNSSTITGEMKHGVNLSKVDDSNSSSVTEINPNLSSADFTFPDMSLDLRNDSMSLDVQNWPNITDNILKNHLNSSNKSTKPSHVQQASSPTPASNVPVVTYNYITVANGG